MSEQNENGDQGGVLTLVGIGPGAHEFISPAGLDAIRDCDMVVGYRTYMLLVRSLIKDKEVVKTGMTEEISRARAAVHAARDGKKVVVVSSGDAGVYGMGPLIFEVLKEEGWTRGSSPEIRVIPGITALNACASLVGAPLGHDSCMISLSDLLTPWEVIEKRIEAAAAADFVIGFYNPASGRRQKQIVIARQILLQHRPAETPVALIKSAYRHRQNVVMTDLQNFTEHDIGMLTTVLVGSTNTYMYEGFMVTPRGYANKYEVASGAARAGQTPGISLRTDRPDLNAGAPPPVLPGRSAPVPGEQQEGV